MSYSEERDRFIAECTKAGIKVMDARLILRHAATLQRNAELASSSEWADRDRVPCPGVKRADDCICEHYQCDETDHHEVTRIARQDARLERRIASILAEYPGVEARFQGDPRGYVCRILRPAESRDPHASVGIGVPVR